MQRKQQPDNNILYFSIGVIIISIVVMFSLFMQPKSSKTDTEDAAISHLQQVEKEAEKRRVAELQASIAKQAEKASQEIEKQKELEKETHQSTESTFNLQESSAKAEEERRIQQEVDRRVADEVRKLRAEQNNNSSNSTLQAELDLERSARKIAEDEVNRLRQANSELQQQVFNLQNGNPIDSGALVVPPAE